MRCGDNGGTAVKKIRVNKKKRAASCGDGEQWWAPKVMPLPTPNEQANADDAANDGAAAVVDSQNRNSKSLKVNRQKQSTPLHWRRVSVDNELKGHEIDVWYAFFLRTREWASERAMRLELRARPRESALERVTQYRVILKRVLHKREEKVQEKMKMI